MEITLTSMQLFTFPDAKGNKNPDRKHTAKSCQAINLLRGCVCVFMCVCLCLHVCICMPTKLHVIKCLTAETIENLKGKKAPSLKGGTWGLSFPLTHWRKHPNRLMSEYWAIRALVMRKTEVLWHFYRSEEVTRPLENKDPTTAWTWRRPSQEDSEPVEGVALGTLGQRGTQEPSQTLGKAGPPPSDWHNSNVQSICSHPEDRVREIEKRSLKKAESAGWCC